MALTQGANAKATSNQLSLHYSNFSISLDIQQNLNTLSPLGD